MLRMLRRAMTQELGTQVGRATAGSVGTAVASGDFIMRSDDVSVGFGAATIMQDISVGFQGSINARIRTVGFRARRPSAVRQPDA